MYALGCFYRCNTFAKKCKNAFMNNQINQQCFCQSCGMPLASDADCGCNADGSTNQDYCRYCYENGHFVQECTMDEMIEHCANFIDEMNKHMPKPMTRDEYKQKMRNYFPMLKRWKQ